MAHEQYVFGAGRMWSRQAGNAATPVEFGLMQDVSLSLDYATDSRYGRNTFPLVLVRGNARLTGQARFASICARLFSEVLMADGNAPAAGALRTAVSEQQTVDANQSVTVTNNATFVSDLGVMRASDHDVFEKVFAEPDDRQYACNESTGVYSFANSATNVPVVVSYTWSDTTGNEVALTNPLAGQPCLFSLVLNQTFQGKSLTVVLNACAADRLSMPARLEDFILPSVSFKAIADANGVIGTISLDDDQKLTDPPLLYLIGDEVDLFQWTDQSPYQRGLTFHPNAGLIYGDANGAAFVRGLHFDQVFPGQRSSDYYNAHSWVEVAGNINVDAEDFRIEFTSFIPASLDWTTLFGMCVIDNYGNPANPNGTGIANAGYYVYFINEGPSGFELVFSAASDNGIDQREIHIPHCEADFGTRTRYTISRKGRKLTSFREGAIVEQEPIRFAAREGIIPRTRGWMRIGCFHQKEAGFDAPGDPAAPELIDGYANVIDELVIFKGSQAGIDTAFTPRTHSWYAPQ